MPLYLWLLFTTISHGFSSTLAQSDTYIIHMDSSAMPKAFSNHHTWYMATLDSIPQNPRVTTTGTTTTTTFPSSSKLIYSYKKVIQGFSASLSPSELESLKKSPGYISAIRDLPVKADTTHTAEFLGLNTNSSAWLESNYGEGVIIGVIDTGVWPESPSFNDQGMTEIPSRWKGECEVGFQFNSSMCNKKLIGARFFNKGLIASNPLMVRPLSTPRDINGHGTHTASTAAGSYVDGASYFNYASGTAKGMAPKAHVAVYKVLWEVGSYTSDVVAAIDQAIMDGVDVISISLGSDVIPLYEDPIAIATFAALEKGIFVSTSAGNAGPSMKTLHNGTPWVLTVAAGTIDRQFGGVITLGNGVSINGSSLYAGSNSYLTEIPIVYMEACDDMKELSEVGYKIVVCLDGNETLITQVDNVGNANVAGGVFISDSPRVKLLMQSSFPATFLNHQDGPTVVDYIRNTSDPKVSIEFKRTFVDTKPAPKVARYSSRGPSKSCPFVLKPDLMAPGELILASWPQNRPVTRVNSQFFFSNFNLLSGTSMSTPHVAGVAALVKAAHPEWSPAAIRSAMMTTSVATDDTLEPIKDVGDNNQVATPLAMGAGHINPNKALDPGLIYDTTVEDYINLLCAMNYTKKQIQTIVRPSSTSINCSNPSLDLNYPSFLAFFNAQDSESDLQTVREFKRTVTNVGEGMSNYSATVTPMDGFRFRVVPDKLFFKEKDEKLSYQLSIYGPRRLKERVVFGYLSWVDSEDKHVVKSPIVATNL